LDTSPGSAASEALKFVVKRDVIAREERTKDQDRLLERLGWNVVEVMDAHTVI